jgi:hypothetical protein
MQVLLFLDEKEEEILERYMKKNNCSSKNNAIKQIIKKQIIKKM